MAKTIGQLTQTTTIAGGDEFVIEQSTQTKRVAASVVRGGLVDANIDAAAAIAGSKLADGGVTLAKLATAVANALVPVGCVEAFARSTAPTGWLAANGNTIGSASSGANNASADYSALFTVLWDNWSNTDLPILDSAGAASTRGASASADFSANKRLPLPDLRGIFVRGSGSQTISGTSYSGTFAAKQQATEIYNNYSNARVPDLQNGVFNSDAATTRSVQVINNVSNAGLTTVSRDFSSSRPANIALLYCIKF